MEKAYPGDKGIEIKKQLVAHEEAHKYVIKC